MRQQLLRCALAACQRQQHQHALAAAAAAALAAAAPPPPPPPSLLLPLQIAAGTRWINHAAPYTQPGIDYAAWACQAQARRCFAAAPARALADNMAAVAERKLAEAAGRWADLQAQIEAASPSSDAYQRLMREAAQLAPLAEGYEELRALEREASSLRELLEDDDDGGGSEAAGDSTERELRALARDELAALQRRGDELRAALMVHLLPPEDADSRGGVVLEVRAGVGGEWAGDFAADLLDMYQALATERGWRFQLLESRPTDLGGVKGATALVSGPGAFAALRWESGVHRATMVPANEKHGRMQTGTCAVVALPEASDVEVSINEGDLRVETCRASGKGGQHVNTTDSAVRIVHLPTGVVVTCQNERSQGQNKAQAMRVLRAKLHEMELQRQAASLSAQRRAAAGLANANERIRSYNYQDSRISDHRVPGLTLQVDVRRFMADGARLGEVIDAVRLQHQRAQLEELLLQEEGE